MYVLLLVCVGCASLRKSCVCAATSVEVPTGSVTAPAVMPTAGATPDYVVEEPLESQALWHATAGTQPPQPKHERDFYEDLYAKRLEQSAASLRIADSSPRPPGSEHVRWRVSNSFGGESALRSWQCHRCPEVCTMSLSLTKLQTVDAGRWRGHADPGRIGRHGRQASHRSVARRYQHAHLAETARESGRARL